LVSAGALHATPAQAFLVPEVTLERYSEVNAIRKSLECMAVAAACNQMTDEKLETLRDLSEKFHDAMSNGEVERALHTNRAFRFTLYHYADMPTLISLIEQLWVRIGPCFNCLYDPDIVLPSRSYRYDELLDALAKGDQEASRAAIDKAIDEANEILIRQFAN